MKRIFLAIIFFTMAFAGHSQSHKFYIGVTGGYGVGILKNYIMFNNDLTNYYTWLALDMIDIDTSHVDGKKISLTEGVTVGMFLGYKISNRLSFELMGKYNKSNNFKAESLPLYPSYPTCKCNLNSESIFVIPQLKYYLDTGRVSYYLKTGLIISSSVVYYSQDLVLIYGSPVYETDKYKFYEGYNFGFYESFGVEYKVTTRLTVFGDLSASFINFWHKKVERTEKTMDGEDFNNDELNRGTRELDLYPSYTPSFTGSGNPKALTQIFPASNTAFSAGVLFKF